MTARDRAIKASIRHWERLLSGEDTAALEKFVPQTIEEKESP